MVHGGSEIYVFDCVKRIANSYGIAAVLASGILYILTWFVSYIVLYYVGGIIILAAIMGPIVNSFVPKEKVSADGKAVFISGCDTGFGHMLAQRLDDLGFQVFAGCLFPEAEGAQSLKRLGSSRLHVLALDVTKDQSVEDAAIYVKENIQRNVLWAVVNNAGIQAGGCIHWTDMEKINRVYEVNTLGVARVTKAFLSTLKDCKGRVVTVASAAGRQNLPGIVPYSMSKAAAISFCDGLRLEMYKWGIQVISIEPFFFKTAIMDKDLMTENLKQTWESNPQHVKDMYPPNYIEKYIRQTIRVTTRFGNPDVAQVVTKMEDAVTTLFPDYHFRPGNLFDRLLFWFLQNMPKPVSDMCLAYSIMSKNPL